MTQESTAPAPKRARPRDELGRPLPWGAANRLQLEDYDALGIDEDHRLGVAHFNAGRYFPAHEAWESAWRQCRGGPDEEFFKGLSQLGAGYTHWRRGNAHGAFTLLRRAASRICRYGERHLGTDAKRVSEEAVADADAIERAAREGNSIPELRLPRI